MLSRRKLVETIEEIRERQSRRKSKQKENRIGLGIGTRTTRVKNQPGAIEDVDALLKIVNQLRKANAENQAS